MSGFKVNGIFIRMKHIQSGIYKIINIVNGKYYIGSTNNLSYRWYRHRMHLIAGNHINSHLQNAWNKYGEDKFQFIVIENCSEKDLFKREFVYLKECENNPDTTYNLSFFPGGGALFKGKKHSEYTKQKMSEQRRGKNHPQYGTHMSSSTKTKIIATLKKKMSGKGNPRFDNTFYKFIHEKSNQSVEMTRYDFYTKYNLDPSNVNKLIRGRIKKLSGWIINN